MNLYTTSIILTRKLAVPSVLYLPSCDIYKIGHSSTYGKFLENMLKVPTCGIKYF